MSTKLPSNVTHSDNKVLEKRCKRRKKQAQSADDGLLVVTKYMKTLNVAPHDASIQTEFLKELQRAFNAEQRPVFSNREFASIKLMSASSPSEFYVLKTQFISNAEKFQQSLAEQFQTKSFERVYAPQVGIICCVKRSNSTWQRCQILKLYQNSTCKLHLFDIGVTEKASFAALRMLNDTLVRHNRIAAQCALVSVDSALPITNYNKQQMEHFRALLNEYQQFYVFVNCVRESHSEVFLYYCAKDSTFRCVNEIFDDENQDSDLASDEYTSSNGDKNEPVHSSREKVILMHIASVDAIYVSLKKFEAGLKKLQLDIQTFVDDTDKDLRKQDWKTGDFCLVAKQNSWYRGVIIETMPSNGKCVVFLRDVGSSHSTETSKLRLINDKLCNVCNGVIKCRMSGIESNGFSTLIVNDKLRKIVDTCDELAISIYGNESVKNDISVILWGIHIKVHALLPEQYEWTNINTELIKAGVVTSDKRFLAIDYDASKQRIDVEFAEILENDFDKVDGNENMKKNECNEIEPHIYNISNAITEVKEWLASEPIGKKEFLAFPTYVNKKCEVFLLDAYRKGIAEQMKDLINKKLRETPIGSQDPHKWKKGDACIARYERDKLFYRATIRRIDFSKRICVVRFVDYGNAESCKFKYLLKPNMFANVPVLTRTYCLENIQPISGNGKWPDDVIAFCSNTIIDKQCRVTVYGTVVTQANYVIERCCLHTYDSDKDLRSALIKRRLAAALFEK